MEKTVSRWLLFGLLLVVAPPLLAQPWAGPAGVGVRVRDGDGNNVSGAEVTLYYLGDRELGGPAPVLTDDDGRAEIGGLAEGLWFVRVRHPRFLSYEADIEISAGRKPKERRTARRKEGDAVAMNKVRFFEASSDAPRPEARTEEVTSSRARPLPTAEPPSGTAGAEATDVPPPPAPPTPVPVAPPSDSSSLGRYLRSARDGSCFDCRPNEWALLAVGPRRPGGPGAGCPEDLEPVAEEIAAALGDLGGFAGPLLDPSTGEGVDLLGGELQERLGLIFDGVPAGCQLLPLRLPNGSRFVGFQYDVVEGEQVTPCLPGDPCAGEDGRFPAPPIVVRRGGVVLGAFEHPSRPGERQPRLVVYFVPRSDWRPTL